MKSYKIAIVDYEMCNLFSVSHACEFAGVQAIITRDPKTIMQSDGVILPGVGAFGDAMKNLKKHGLIQVVKDVVQSGKPFMGICLGLQLLFSGSEEFGDHEGLGIIPGIVKKFPESANGKRVKVPQIGWNRIKKQKDHAVLSDVPDGAFMYFVHSFYVEPEERESVLTSTEYEGLDYCSSIQKNNTIAFQFHPEKSAGIGLGIYTSWKNIIEKNNEGKQ